MKKFGFTLAEVLITLAIIGVIAAVTLPSLNANTAMASIGPKLGKAVSVFEQANQALLSDRSVDGLTDAYGTPALVLGGLGNDLGNYMKLSSSPSYLPDNFNIPDGEAGKNCTPQNAVMYSTAMTKDGIIYIIGVNLDITMGIPPHRQLLGGVYIDINGIAQPNEPGTDVFAFNWYNDGSLRPLGAGGEGGCSWNGQNNMDASCPLAAVGDVTDLWACAGHVFENNMKADWE